VPRLVNVPTFDGSESQPESKSTFDLSLEKTQIVLQQHNNFNAFVHALDVPLFLDFVLAAGVLPAGELNLSHIISKQSIFCTTWRESIGLAF
jgi:hypothetical protein